ncbi:hypothetical protein BGZ92_011655 [Podila epicladia]|nr:hypothetical protein BGZ92_011655 [Podila epicladia]
MRKRMSQVCWPVVTLNIDTEEWAYATNVKFAPGESWLSRFLFCLPPTIQSLVLKLPWDSRTQEDENNDLSSKPQFEHRDHQSLTSLTVDATHISNNFPPLQWFLDHCCPNLLQFSYIAMPGHGGLCPLQFNGCPRLEELTLKGTAKGVAIEAMVGSAAPLKRLTLLQTEAKSSWGLFPAIERHFATLEFLHLDDAPASSREIQSILVNCSNLKTFISIPASSMGSDSSLHVGDIDPFKAPWQCLGLKKLKIQFTDVERTCSPPRHRRPDTLVDPASSTSLTPLSPQETLLLSYQDSSPEAIDTYYQLSQLTELETLDISTWALSPLRLDAIRTRTQDAPSGIKSLRDVDFSIRSGLNLLSPLKQLKHLEFPPSQFGGGHPWNAKIKKDEVEWMCNNWPQLQIFKCNLGHCAAPDFGEGEKAEYWRWWANQQPELRISLSHFE